MGASMRMKISTVILPAMALIALAAAIPTQAASPAPLGFQLMCLRSPEQCQGGGSAAIALDEAILSSIQQINSQVNQSIVPKNDFGGDIWMVGVSSGDCEDYVLTKRVALMRAGLPASALRIAHVKTRQGIDHAVLVIKTDSADLVLDNLDPEIGLLQNTSYRIVAMSGADPMDWN